MVLETLFTTKTNSLIIAALAKGKALTAKEIHHYSRKRETITYQAVHKQVVLLRKAGIVSHDKNTHKYLLNPKWLTKVNAFWSNTLKNYKLLV